MLKNLLCSQLRQNNLYSTGWPSGPDNRLGGGLFKEGRPCTTLSFMVTQKKLPEGWGSLLA